MTRLPTISGDSNAWGSVLNAFLGVAHNADGSLKAFINVKDSTYGAVMDGSTDDTAALAAAMNAANNAGGGTVFVPAGTLITGNQTLYSNVHLLGAGIGATTIKLKNGANADLFSAYTSSINLGGAFGAGSTTGISSWSIQNMTLDGNRANQSSGTSYPLRFYGYGYILHNMRVINGYSGGILCDWRGGNSSSGETIECQWSNMKALWCNAIGIEVGGPSDMMWTNIVSAHTLTHCVHIAPNAAGLQITNMHTWSPASGVNAVGWLVEADDVLCVNCESEGADTANVVVLANSLQWIGGRVFAGSIAGAGFQIGQTSGGTPYSGQINVTNPTTTENIAPVQYIIRTLVTDITNTNGSFWFVNDGGYGLIDSVIYQTVHTWFTGSPHGFTVLRAIVNGLTSDGTRGLSNFFRLHLNAFSGFTVVNDVNDVFNINASSQRFEMPYGTYIRGYSDGYTTQTYSIGADGAGSIISNGSLSTGESATEAATASNGTINTAGVGEAKVAPTGNITGVILQAGTVKGQEVVVVNHSAFTITFNTTPATSNVAGSAADPAIPANCCRLFKWNSSTNLWYRAA